MLRIILPYFLLFNHAVLAYTTGKKTNSAWNLIVTSARDNIIRGTLGHETQYQLPNELSFEEYDLIGGFTHTWSDGARVALSSRYDKVYNVTCQDVSWQAIDCRTKVFEDCFSLGEAHWYGGAAVYQLEWPMEKWDIEMTPFVTGDSIAGEGNRTAYGGVLERYWLNSDGFALIVDWEVPLWVSVNSDNDQLLCFRSTYEDSPYTNIDDSPLFLNYSICQAADMKEMQMYAIENVFNKPLDIPDELLFRYPIYSTWARYHRNINQSLVLDYAREINYYNYSNAQMEIDDDWEDTYGRLDFDFEKFPDPKGMVDELASIGFRTTLWVHPFTALSSNYLWAGSFQFVFLSDPEGILPGLTIWWNGVATIIDFTGQRGIDWFVEHLTDLQLNYGIDSFKFDAGEAHWLPAAYRPREPFRNPCDYTTKMVETAFSVDQDVRHQEVRAGARTQHIPIFVRLLDKSSRWGYDNGLKTVIPHVLLFSVIGYVFPLPDMIGGNAYDSFPDRELYIRWTQVNVFLPGFQFSIVPWQFDEEVIDICRSMLLLHESYADLMIELARNATETGEPIIRPLWWHYPLDEVAQTLDSEFLLGDGLLSAPVIDPGVTTRDVYLPQGRWRDMNNPDTILDGPLWYTDYPAPITVLPYFVKV